MLGQRGPSGSASEALVVPCKPLGGPGRPWKVLEALEGPAGPEKSNEGLGVGGQEDFEPLQTPQHEPWKKPAPHLQSFDTGFRVLTL